MENKTSPTKDATREIDRPPAPPSPHTSLADPGPAFIGEAGKKLPRKLRRQAWYGPILEKIRRQQEKQQKNQATIGESCADGTSARDNVSRVQAVDLTNRPSYEQRRNNGVQVGDCSSIPHGPRSPPNPRTRTRPRHDSQAHRLASGLQGYESYGVIASQPHFPVTIPRYPLHPFLHNLRNPALRGPAYLGSQAGFEILNSAYIDRQRIESQSSATHVGDAAWAPTMALPMVLVTPSGTHGHSERPTPDQAEIGRSVVGMGPPTPYMPSVEDSHIEAELDSPIEPLQLIPDPESSNCAPRTDNNEWDGITQVADVQQRSQQPNAISVSDLPSSEAIVEMLFSKMKEPAQTPDRSWTFPGREPSLSPLTSFDSGDAMTMVEEPQELSPKADSLLREVLRPVKSVENFFSSLSNDLWVTSN